MREKRHPRIIDQIPGAQAVEDLSEYPSSYEGMRILVHKALDTDGTDDALPTALIHFRIPADEYLFCDYVSVEGGRRLRGCFDGWPVLAVYCRVRKYGKIGSPTEDYFVLYYDRAGLIARQEPLVAPSPTYPRTKGDW